VKRTFKVLTMVAVIAALVVPVQALAVNARNGNAVRVTSARKALKASTAAARLALAKLKAQVNTRLAKRKGAFNRAASALQRKIHRVRVRAVAAENSGAVASVVAAQAKLDGAKAQQVIAVSAYGKVQDARTVAGVRAALKAAKGEGKKTGQLLKDARNSLKAALGSLKATT